jgi:hypothetical protein
MSQLMDEQSVKNKAHSRERSNSNVEIPKAADKMMTLKPDKKSSE